MTPDIDRNCPLCSARAQDFHNDTYRRYFRCPECRLVFVPSESFLSPRDERAEYALHENSPDDAGYRAFLSRMSSAIEARVPPGGRGLDFGSGPGPTLSVMLEEAGRPTALYDQFFAPDPSVLETTYDFVTATEVVEHLRSPASTLEVMWGCVRPGGYLGIMTKMVLGRDEFSRWHYKDDPTHVCFFSRETFDRLAGWWNTRAVFIGRDVVLFRKQLDDTRGARSRRLTVISLVHTITLNEY